jgi:hypothetical protein
MKRLRILISHSHADPIWPDGTFKIKSGIKMLDLSSVPDMVVFFDDKGEKYSLDNFEGKNDIIGILDNMVCILY